MSYDPVMLVNLTPQELDSFAPIDADGSIRTHRTALLAILGAAVDAQLTGLALTEIDYLRQEDGTPEPDTRTTKGIAWKSLGDNRASVWSFRSDGRALSITDEGEHGSPISQDDVLIAKATRLIADEYPGSVIDERSGRIDLRLLDSTRKKARVVVVHDRRIMRPEDALPNDIEVIAYRAGTLAVVIVQPLESGQAIVRKIGL